MSENGNGSRSRTGIGRNALEAATIIISILLALLLDAAWDYRRDRAEERDYLRSLREEFAANALELESDQAQRATFIAQVDALLDVAAGRDGARLSPDSLPLWLASAVDYRFYSPAHSVLDDLISSGNLGLIRTDALRYDLLDYEQEVERLAVAEERERDFVAEQLEPYLAARLPLPEYVPSSPNIVITLSPAQLQRFRPLLSDPHFISLLYLRRERTETALRFARGLEGIIERLREQLAAAVGED